MDLPDALLNPRAYPHGVKTVQLIETLLSWVFLTGEYAYKVKKPVRLDFVDFSTLELRRFLCAEELRCNRAFAPELYVGLVPVVRTPGGKLALGEREAPDDPAVVDWAVKMRQFDQSAQADRLVERGQMTSVELDIFGRTLAAQHATLPRTVDDVDAVGPMMANFDTLRSLACARDFSAALERIEEATVADVKAARHTVTRRHQEGFVRECHGDLHLANLVRTDSGIRAFDCLEFDAALRNIDVISDAAFLFMDCCVRTRSDLGFAFVDGYLDTSGDYEGATLLPLYARYRSLVRAKVAALRNAQSPSDSMVRKLATHIRWAEQRIARPPGLMLVTCGVSGSGKSFWARQLVPALGAIRIRSDILRKRQAGLGAGERSHSSLGTGLYSNARSNDTYRELAALSAQILAGGDNVIVDAANLTRAQRRTLYAVANRLGARCVLLHLVAPERVLEERIARREQERGDPSEADVNVLRWQLQHRELPDVHEPHVDVDTTTATLSEIIDQIGTNSRQ